MRAGSGQVERSLADHRRYQTVRGAAGPGAHFPGLRGARRGIPSCGPGGRGGEALPRGARPPPRVRHDPAHPRQGALGVRGGPGGPGRDPARPRGRAGPRAGAEDRRRGRPPGGRSGGGPGARAALGRAGSARPRRAGTVPGARRGRDGTRRGGRGRGLAAARRRYVRDGRVRRSLPGAGTHRRGHGGVQPDRCPAARS